MTSLIINDLFGKRDMVKIAIERLTTYEKSALNMNKEGYWVGISGGKDSTVIYDLVKKSDVKATFHHSLTTVDAPETIHFLRNSYNDIEYHRPKKPLLLKIRNIRTAPPSRNGRRWCCRDYKERWGNGNIVVTGVRAEESARRSGYKLIENCMTRKNKRFLHVIIDWTTEMVWEYIKINNLPINPLYKEPYNLTRVGCVLCPLALPKIEIESRKYWPKIVIAWEKAIKAWYNKYGNECCDIDYIKTDNDYWKWWLSGNSLSFTNEKQQTLIFDEPKEVLL